MLRTTGQTCVTSTGRLRLRFPLQLILACVLCMAPVAAAADSLCAPLKAFVTSVKPGESRELTFHTVWGGNFKDFSEIVADARRCSHGDYPPARKVCDYLVAYGAVEFAGNNVKDALACLSPETRIADDVMIDSASFSFSIGTDDRGSLIEIAFHEDVEIGGMAFRIRVEVY